MVNNKEKPAIPPAKRGIIIAVAAFLAAVLIFGTVLTAITCADEENASIHYGSVRVSKSVAAYLALAAKYAVMRSFRADGVPAVNSEAFFDREYLDGESYGAVLVERIVTEIAKTVIAASIFDRYRKLDASEKAAIDAGVAAIEKDMAREDRAWIYAPLVKLGFQGKEIRNAVTLVCKARYAMSAVYGDNYAGALADTEVAEMILSNYAHVGLIFVRTEIMLENGVERETTAEERAAREEIAASIREKIENKTMDLATFLDEMEKHGEGDASRNGSGYYFLSGNAYTDEFAEMFPTVVGRAETMPVGGFAEVETFIGPCFICRVEGNLADYDATDPYFNGFAKAVADISYEKLLDELVPEVGFTERFMRLDFLRLPFDAVYNPINY